MADDLTECHCRGAREPTHVKLRFEKKHTPYFGRNRQNPIGGIVTFYRFKLEKKIILMNLEAAYTGD